MNAGHRNAAQSNSLSLATNQKATGQTSTQEPLLNICPQNTIRVYNAAQTLCRKCRIGACRLQIQEEGMGQGQDSCCDDRLKPRLRRFMAARPPAMPSFTRSLAVAVAAVARAAASLAPNLRRHQQTWSVKHVLITTSHLKYCFEVESQHTSYSTASVSPTILCFDSQEQQA